MTAIADIIVNNSNPANLQLSQNIKENLTSNSTTSFSDLVAFYKDEQKNAVSLESESTAPVEKSETPVNKEASGKNDEAKVSESSAEEKTESVTKSEKNQEEGKKSESVKDEEKGEPEIKDLKKKVSKAEVQEKDAESKADIQAEENNLKYFEDYTASLMNTQNSEVKEVKELKVETADVEIAMEATVSENLISEQLQIAKADESSDMDFSDLLKKETSGKTETKLDKDGKITVQDLRTDKTEVSDKNEPKLKTQLKVTSENTATMTMTYAEETVQSDVLSLNNQTAGSNGSNFQSMLNNQLQANVPEFVKAGNIVLKDNNQGTINLILHPDDLGNVKIHLSLDGKTLSGHITVATKEALQVFKDNSETLREAFIKNGFDSASFEVSYGNGGSGNQNFDFDQRNDGTNHFGRNMYSSVAGSSGSESGEFLENQESFGNYSVNIVA